jgi:hypothetical protein
MNEVQKMAIRKALRTLEIVKDVVQYAVEFDGQAYGNRKLAPVKDTKRPPRYPHGATRKHFLPYLEKIKDGGVTNIPFGDFDGKVLSSNISAACVHFFGKGNATVHMNKDTKHIEVLAVPGESTPEDRATRTLMDIWGDDDLA